MYIETDSTNNPIILNLIEEIIRHIFVTTN